MGAGVTRSFIYCVADQLWYSHGQYFHWVLSLVLEWSSGCLRWCVGSLPNCGAQFGHPVLNVNDSAKRKDAAPGGLYFTGAQNKGCSKRESHAYLWAACTLKTQGFFFVSVCVSWISLLYRYLAAGIFAFTGPLFYFLMLHEEKLDPCCTASFCPQLWLPLPAAECHLSLPNKRQMKLSLAGQLSDTPVP